MPLRILRLAGRVRRAIRDHAAADYPREACGLLLGAFVDAGWTATGVHAAANLAPGHRRYVLDPIDFVRAQARADRRGLEVVGVYHSHPDHPAIPSTLDGARGWPVFVYLIVRATTRGPGPMRAWWLPGEGRAFQEAAIRVAPLSRACRRAARSPRAC